MSEAFDGLDLEGAASKHKQLTVQVKDTCVLCCEFMTGRCTSFRETA